MFKLEQLISQAVSQGDYRCPNYCYPPYQPRFSSATFTASIPRGHRWTLDLAGDYKSTWFQSVMVIPANPDVEFNLGLTILSAEGPVAEFPGELHYPNRWATLTAIPHISFDLGGPRESLIYINVDDRAPTAGGIINAIGMSGILVDNLGDADDPVTVSVWFIGPDDRIVPPDIGP
jgi:hypothetical protein